MTSTRLTGVEGGQAFAEDGDFADEHNELSLVDEQPGGPEGEPEDDAPRGLAGADRPPIPKEESP